MLSPNAYAPDFKGTCALYARGGNPLLIPETGPVAGNLFWAVGHHAALAWSPFGSVERLKPDGQLGHALAKLVKELGFEVTTGVGDTGLVAILPNGPGPSVMLRTELDALPIEEKTGLPFASKASTRNAAGMIERIVSCRSANNRSNSKMRPDRCSSTARAVPAESLVFFPAFRQRRLIHSRLSLNEH